MILSESIRAAEHVVELLVEENARSLALLHRILPSALMLSLTGSARDRPGTRPRHIINGLGQGHSESIDPDPLILRVRWSESVNPSPLIRVC